MKNKRVVKEKFIEKEESVNLKENDSDKKEETVDLIETINDKKEENINKKNLIKTIKGLNKEDAYKIFESIICNNNYVKNCKSNEKKDVHSLSYLIDNKLSQSDCIKLGIGIETVLRDIVISQNKNLINIKKKNSKGNKEKDHLFMDKENKIIYYAELKSNLNLDTEKSKITYQKCMQIEKELQNEYKEYQINMYLLSIRHYKKDIIPDGISKKYQDIDENLIGINEYLKNLSIPIQFNDEDEYKKIINLLANKMFKL